ncbi:glycerol-3-phosphate phosphatase isoform X1 [Thrips palmi]|uniref:Glycerol-3-phosphate phosphatase isoform X1 n=1 Tax=Thrips palmi TaxID=161013 RepID=A0A6P9AAI7_THRPL|nr:glycerol-3-phosphate phosphatase isoform X1 [Thrips palmi]XP_034253081.1 glycerol-3-phosphate phosphatase isoform X1 [Thrips palmi]
MAALNLSNMKPEDFKEFMNSFDTVLTDCDGVLWLGTTIIQGSPNAINFLKKSGKRIFYVTNNSTKTQKELLSKIDSMGFNASEEEVVSTAYLAAKYLQEQGFKDKVYVIGSTGITQEMDMAGIKHTDIGPDHMPSSLPQLISQKLDPEVKAVVVGFDEHFSYPKMLKAASYLARKDCLFVATNTDEQFPMNTELVIPGTGSIVRAVETCGARNAFVVGKPHSYISEFLVKTHKIDPTRTIMIGDRCNTDILLGKRCGFKTLLVLSGVSTVNEINSWKESSDEELRQLVPDFYIGKLGDLLPMME